MSAAVPSKASHSSTRSATQTLFLVVAAAAILALVLGYAWLRYHTHKAKMEAFGDLSLMADFKARELSAWLAERRSDARLLAETPRFGEDLAEIIATGKPPKTGPVIRFLGTLMRVYAYQSAYLLDSKGRFVFAVGAGGCAGRQKFACRACEASD